MFWSRSKKDYPIFYRQYLERIQDEGFSNDFIALDMETTGLDPKKAGVLSFASIPIRDRKIIVAEEKHLFFNCQEENQEAIHIHELFSDSQYPPIADCLPEILLTIANHQILGHFVQFDVALVNRQLYLMKLPKLKNPQVDTLKLALKKDGIYDNRFVSKGEYTLFSLCQRYGINIQSTHDALEDSYLAALLYLHLTDH